TMLPELMVASTVSTLLSLALPLALLQIYDRIIPHRSASTLALLMGGVVSALVLDGLIRTGRGYITGWLGASFEHRLNCTAFRHLLRANIDSYEREGGSVYLERMRAIGQMRDFYSGQALLSLFDLPFVFLYMGIIALLGGWLVLVPVVVLTLFAVLALHNGGKLGAFVRGHIEFEERRFSFISQTLSGIHTVKTMAMEAMMLRRYELLQDTNVHKTMEGSKYSITAVNLGAFFAQISTAVVVAAGAVFVIRGHMTPGALAACITLTGRSMQPLNAALAVWVRFQEVIVAKQQLDKLFATPASVNADAPFLPPIEGALKLEGVSLRFSPTAEPLFENLSISVEQGECVAILGDNGSGKSSLLSMMAGMLEPTAGRVMVDGHDLSRYASVSLPRQIGYLPQRGLLFEGTILENITMFDPEMEDEGLAVAKAIGMDTAVAGMRNGYNTRVGNSATDAIPGGVKQRISIARALLHKPRIILFDEANIALDSVGDDLVRAYLETLKGQCTMVLVTHRPSLLKLAGRRFTLSGGKLVPEVPEPAPARQEAVQGVARVFGERPPEAEDVYTALFSRFRKQSDLCLCLPRLLHELHWQGLPRQLAEVLPHFAETLTLDGFRRTLAGLRYVCEDRKISLRQLEPPMLPCLFLPEDGDAMIVLQLDLGRGVRVFEGGRDAFREMPRDDVKGEAHIFRPIEAPARGGESGSWLTSVLGRFRPFMALAFGLTLALNLMVLVGPTFMMSIYDRILPSGDIMLIPFLLLGLFVVMAADWILRQLRARVLSYMGSRGEYIVGTAMFERILGLPASAVEGVSVGSQVARIKDFETLKQLFVGPLSMLFYELPGTIVFILVLGLINGWLLLFLLAAVLSFALLGIVAQPGVNRRNVLSSQSATALHEFMSEALENMRGVKFAGAEVRWFERFRALSSKAATMEYRSSRFNLWMVNGAQILGNLTAISIITTCVVGAFEGTMAVGAVVGSMIITWRLVAPMQSGFLSLSTLARARRSMRQIDGLMRLQAERDTNRGRNALPTLEGGLAFSRVSFRYTNDADPVLLGVNFKVDAGTVVGIAGPN
ncbi:MAG: ATP-binding cassette domain-containing protein, partial [Alphaproteobacteria bacterium]|nr:ATP-binding cassette domain-containing protein [Alphaproteobacteria bacterium]